jgi:hypothetical protein
MKPDKVTVSYFARGAATDEASSTGDPEIDILVFPIHAQEIGSSIVSLDGAVGASLGTSYSGAETKMMNRSWGAGCLMFLLGACSQEQWMQKLASPAEQSTARGYIDHLRNREFTDIEIAADMTIAGPALHGTLEKMAGFIPNEAPRSVKLVGAQRSRMSGATTLNLTFEYQFPDRWIVANVATKSKDGVTTIFGFHVYPESSSLESTNRFTLSGKSVLQYVVLGAAIAAGLFTFVVLIVCIRTQMKRRKWLWILFILFGLGKLSVNWTTGQWGFMALAAQLFSAAAAAPLYGPWIVSVSLPIGAVLFLINRRKLQVASRADKVAVP